MAIKMGNTARVAHVNCIRPFLEINNSDNGQTTTSWSSPLFQQLDVEDSHSRPTSPIVTHSASAPPVPPQVVTRSRRVVKPVVRYGQVDDSCSFLLLFLKGESV